MSSVVLSVRGLRKTFRRSTGLKKQVVEALKGIDFDIEAGTITGFLGGNGAGKTTTIKCLLNLAFADSGTVQFFGSPELTPAVRSRIGFLPERPYFYEYLTGREFLRFYGELSTQLKSAELRSRVEYLLKRVGLVHASDRPLRSYSKGMLQRIGIAQALVNEPEFIILDEPMTGLDPDGRQEVRDLIRETANRGTAVFFSSHLLPDAEELCERLVILRQGELVFAGPMQEILDRFHTGYRVTYESAGLVESMQVASLDALQTAIDERRSLKLAIREVKAVRLSLEEVFKRIALGGTK